MPRDVDTILNEAYDSGLLTIDIETVSPDGGGSLNRFTGQIAGIALGWANSDSDIDADYIDFVHPDGQDLPQADFESFRKKFNHLLDKYENPLNFHNAGFDVPWLWYNDIRIPDKNLLDTMLMTHLMNSNSSNSLDDCVNREFDYEMSEISEASFDLIPDDFYKYAYDDGYYQTKLCLRYIEKLKEKDLYEYYGNIITPLIPCWCKMVHNGFKLNRDGLEKMKNDIREYQHALERKKYDYAHVPNNFNFNSPKQLAELFFGKQSPDDGNDNQMNVFGDEPVGLDLPTDQIQLTDTNNYSTDKETLQHLEGYHPIIRDILEYKNVGKLRNTFVENLLKTSEYDSRAYTELKPHGTKSGRFSSSGPNLQNIPTNPEVDQDLEDVPRLHNEDLNIRKHFVAPDGRKLVVADYSQLELRINAHYSEEATLLNPYKSGTDVHKTTASLMFDIPVDEVPDKGGKRFTSKTCNYSLQYLAKVWKFSQTADFKWEKAVDLYNRWWDTKPDVIEFYKKVLHMIKKRNPKVVKTLRGRPRYFNKELSKKDLGKTKHSLKGNALKAYGLAHYNILNEVISHIIQGTGADIMNKALGNLHEEFRNTNTKILLQVHDEAVLECDTDKADDVSDRTKEIMENCIDLKVPLITEPTICNKWSKAK